MCISNNMNKKDIDRIIASTKASWLIEGLEISKEAEELGRQYLEGKITINEAIKMVKELHLKEN